MPEVVDKDTTLIVKGKVRVVDGKATVFGCPVREISSDFYFPLYIEEGRVEVDGTFIPVKGSTVPGSWVGLSEKVKDVSSVFLIGETDSGKSSLAVWLINTFEGEVCVVDADVGQADVAHPGAMGIGVAGKVPFLRDVKMLDGFFAGTISPMGREAKCIRGFASLCKKAENLKKELTVVDTTGWVKGKRARDYKLAKLEIFNPDIVVFTSSELLKLYEEDVSAECISVDSFVPKKRNKEMRLEIRSKIYKKWLEPSASYVVDRHRLKGTTLFRGEEMKDRDLLSALSVFGDVIFAETGCGFLNVCVEKAEVNSEAVRAVKDIFGVDEVNVFEPEWFENLICGVYSLESSEEKYICPGLVESVDFEEKKIFFRAKEMESTGVVVELGEFKLVNGREEFVRIP